MQANIPYGDKTVKIDIQESCRIILPNKVTVKDEEKTIKDALKKPIDSESFKKFVTKSKKLLIIVNDASKPTPTPKILKQIYPLIKNHTDVKFIVATGTHKPPNEEQLKFIFGKFYDDYKKQIFIHDSKIQKNMKYLGTTKKGTEIYINKMVTETKNIIVIGSVEPHYFAGYTGGRKAFFPGVAAYKTVEMNHKFALEDNACSLSLKTNPIHNDLTEAVGLLKEVKIFSIQTVLTDDYEIYAAKCGDIIKSFDAAIKNANEIYCTPIKNKANIVITVVPSPMDINLYQSQHSLENAKFALKDDGVIILVSKCRMGVGNDAFLKLLSKAKTPEQVMKILDGKYKLGSHKAVRILKIKSKAELFAVTGLDNKTVETAQFKPFNDIQTAVDQAIKLVKSKGKKPNVIIMPYGNLTVPILK